MRSYSDTFKLLGKSILKNDIIILAFAILCLVFMFLTIINAKAIKRRANDWGKKRNPKFSKFLQGSLSRVYTLFTTTISVFPLLGMLGTVFGLLGLDLASGNMDNIKNNFFIALTSTAWGIIFSVIFKYFHAWIADDVEEQIEIAKKLTEEKTE